MPNAQHCWLCGAEIQRAAAGETVAAPVTVPIEPEQVGSYSLASLMMFMTLVAVVCGAFSIAPGLGIVLTISAVPAFIRTVVLVRRQRALGHQIHGSERALLFASSLGVVILAGFAAAIAFYATCWGGFLAGAAAGNPWGATGEYTDIEWALIVGLGLGGIAGPYVGYRVLIWLSKSGGETSLSGRRRLIRVAAIVLLAIVAAAMILASIYYWF